MQDHTPTGFFPMPKFRFWAAVALLALSAVAINPWTFAYTLHGISILNWLSLLVMALTVVAMGVDFYLDRPKTAAERALLEESASAHHE